MGKLAGCIPDARDPSRVVHTRLEQVRQRVYQVALGYEDCNDAHPLRHDPALQVACDVVPHSGSPLSSQPTLCLLENAVDGRSVRKLLAVLEQHYLDSFTSPPEVVVLDIDSTARLGQPGRHGRGVPGAAHEPLASNPTDFGPLGQHCCRSPDR